LRIETRYRRFILRHLFNRCLVPFETFRKHVEELVRRAEAANLSAMILLQINPLSEHLMENLPGSERNRALYNRALAEWHGHGPVRVVDTHGLIEAQGGIKTLTVDGMHFNAKGHQVIASELEKIIASLRPDAKRGLTAGLVKA
jgi:lysophospholipase L1-like esterase